MKIVFFGCFLMLCACNVFKNKEKREVKLQQTEFFELNDRAQELKIEEHIFTTKSAEEESIEIVAKDVFYWHPDSGLLSRSGPLTVKFKSKLKKDHFSGAIMAVEAHSLKHVNLQQSQQNEEKQYVKTVNKEHKLNFNFWMLAALFLGLLYLFFTLRKKYF